MHTREGVINTIVFLCFYRVAGTQTTQDLKRSFLTDNGEMEAMNT